MILLKSNTAATKDDQARTVAGEARWNTTTQARQATPNGYRQSGYAQDSIIL